MPRSAAPAEPTPAGAPGGAEVIYLDHAATTPPHPAAVGQLHRALASYGNPASRHSAGLAAREALDAARATVATLLGCRPAEVVFTGGGSEAISLALYGTFAAVGFRGHLVTTAIEHSAGLETAAALRRCGVDVTILAPLPGGHVDPAAVAAALRPDTRVVSVMHANNETGAVQPVEEITKLVQAAGRIMHVDAVQTAGKLPIHLLAADLLSVSAHKFGGIKGVGALRVRHGHPLEPIVHGGGQEGGRRAGTENLPGIVAMAAAAAAALPLAGDRPHRQGLERLRASLLAKLSVLDGVRVNGSGPVLAETVSLSFAGVRGDALADILDMHGICVSTGSACHAGGDSPSHVLTAMGLDAEQARGTIRVSFGPTTGSAEIEAAGDRIVAAVDQLRRVSGAARRPASAPQAPSTPSTQQAPSTASTPQAPSTQQAPSTVSTAQTPSTASAQQTPSTASTAQTPSTASTQQAPPASPPTTAPATTAPPTTAPADAAAAGPAGRTAVGSTR